MVCMGNSLHMYIHYTSTLVSLLLVCVDCRDEREVRLAKGTQRARLCVPCCVLRVGRALGWMR